MQTPQLAARGGSENGVYIFLTAGGVFSIIPEWQNYAVADTSSSRWRSSAPLR